MLPHLRLSKGAARAAWSLSMISVALLILLVLSTLISPRLTGVSGRVAILYHGGENKEVFFDRSGQFLATRVGNLKVWRRSGPAQVDASPVVTLGDPFIREVVSAQFGMLEDADVLIVSYRDGTVEAWHGRGYSETSPIDLLADDATWEVSASSAQGIALHSSQGQVALLQTLSSSPALVFTATTRPDAASGMQSAIAWSTCGRYLLAVAGPKEAAPGVGVSCHLWDVQKEAEYTVELEAVDGPVVSVHCQAHDSALTVMLASAAGTVSLYRVTGQEAKQLNRWEVRVNTFVQSRENQDVIGYSSSTGKAYVWSRGMGEAHVRSLKLKDVHVIVAAGRSEHLVVGTVGRNVVGDYRSEVYIVDPAPKRTVESLGRPFGLVRDIAVSPDGRLIVIASSYMGVEVVDRPLLK